MPSAAPSVLESLDAAPDARADDSAGRDVDEEASGMNGSDA